MPLNSLCLTLVFGSATGRRTKRQFATETPVPWDEIEHLAAEGKHYLKELSQKKRMESSKSGSSVIDTP